MVCLVEIRTYHFGHSSDDQIAAALSRAVPGLRSVQSSSMACHPLDPHSALANTQASGCVPMTLIVNFLGWPSGLRLVKSMHRSCHHGAWFKLGP